MWVEMILISSPQVCKECWVGWLGDWLVGRSVGRLVGCSFCRATPRLDSTRLISPESETKSETLEWTPQKSVYLLVVLFMLMLLLLLLLLFVVCVSDCHVNLKEKSFIIKCGAYKQINKIEEQEEVIYV